MKLALRGAAMSCVLLLAAYGSQASAQETATTSAPLAAPAVTAANKAATQTAGDTGLQGIVTAAGDVDTDAEKELNIYNWSDYIGEHTVENFTKEYGIKVHYDTYDSNETLEAKLMAGNTGYDVVFPSANNFARMIKAGIFLPLDKSKLTNLSNMDPTIEKIVSDSADPGNKYAVTYMWGTNGFSYNVDMIKKRMADAPLDSLKMIFDPAVLSKFTDCGVSFLDSPEDVVQLALLYIGKSPVSQNPDDIKAAFKMLAKVRPYITMFDSQSYLNALPNGDRCIAMSWSGDYATAQARADEAGKDIHLAYTVPKEGANVWFDGMLIPKDAPHPKNAFLFLNYMMRPEVIADTTNYINYANANAKATPLVNKEITSNPAIYPDAETMKRLYPAVERKNDIQRILTREWTRFKAGQ